MLINLTDHNGNPASVDPTAVIKIRSALLAEEPKGTVFVDYATNGLFARGTFAAICALFAPHIRLAMLHLPTGAPVALNADGISAVQVSPIVGGKPAYPGKSVAVVDQAHWNNRVEARNMIALKETVAEATAVISNA
ncbi:hypothetical protein [Mesorhizobium sp. M1143]|uniref:hypothetical protein n=1 Tax=Mesorhizobium sp. M1143 TaxID=2957061 RepID=UPI00333AD328